MEYIYIYIYNILCILYVLYIYYTYILYILYILYIYIIYIRVSRSGGTWGHAQLKNETPQSEKQPPH